MKKITALFLFLVTVIFISSCSKKNGELTGVVEKIEPPFITLTANDHQFNIIIDEAVFSNGAVIPGDSATVKYIGSLSDKALKATDICLIPPQGQWIENKVDTTKELILGSQDEERSKRLQEFVNSGK